MIEPRVDRPKTLILGADGQVGAQMLGFLRERDGPENVIPTSRTKRDGWLAVDLAELAAAEQVARLLGGHSIGQIYCIAGMTNVDACEASADLAHRTNARGPGALASYANKNGIKFVYFSTEYVFDGSDEHAGPYSEEALPNPVNVYGASKLAGEQAVRNACGDALVLRTTVVYGPDVGKKNYLYSVLRNLGQGASMRVPKDQVSTPTYNRDLVVTATGLAGAGASGIFHVCGPERLGRLTFAQRIAEAFGLDAGLLQGVATAALGQAARRPLEAGLATTKLVTLYPHFKMRSVAEALNHCSSELKAFLDLGQEVNRKGEIA